MATAFKLPELGEGIKSADVVSVLVKAGDVIKKDQGVIEIESEKASAEVPSPFAGKIVEVRVKEGDKIKPGQVIITVEEGVIAAAAGNALNMVKDSYQYRACRSSTIGVCNVPFPCCRSGIGDAVGA